MSTAPASENGASECYSYMDTTYGICQVAILPVRKTPRHQAEQVTQLLFGEAYQVLEVQEKGSWYRVASFTEGYKGWIESNQHTALTADLAVAYRKSQPVYVTSKTAEVAQGNTTWLLSTGSRLPFYEQQVAEWEEYRLISGTVGLRAEQPVMDTVRLFEETPYLWGGRSVFGIDCSALVQLAFGLAGQALPRDAYQQAKIGEKVSFEAHRPGDLAFFHNRAGKIDHVGILVEAHRIIHAHGRVRVDELTPQGIWQLEGARYSHPLSFLRRILVY